MKDIKAITLTRLMGIVRNCEGQADIEASFKELPDIITILKLAEIEAQCGPDDNTKLQAELKKINELH